MPRRRPPTLREAQQEDVERQWGQAQDELLPWDTKLVHKFKRGTKVVAAVTGLVTGLSTFAGGVVKFVRWVKHGGSTAPAELPKTGVRTVATDFVDEPKPPSTSK